MSTKIICDSCNSPVTLGSTMGLMGKCWVDFATDYSDYRMMPMSREIHLCPECLLAAFKAIKSVLGN